MVVSRKICIAYGLGVIIDWHVWFAKFLSGEMLLEDEPRPWCSLDLDDEALKSIIESNPYESTKELVKMLNTSWFTICRHLKSASWDLCSACSW